MTKKNDKIHYYDGKIHEIIFDTPLKEIRKIITKQIKPNSKVIDIACGTGSLVFDLSNKCKSVIGIELSSIMIKHAKKRQKLRNEQTHTKNNNITFIHADATNLPKFKDQEFDYATISMMLHEVPQDLRIRVLKEAKRISKNIIIADYSTPQPKNIFGDIVKIIEFLAGSNHFKGFKSFFKILGFDSGLVNILRVDLLQVDLGI